jgi:hypothetical protein
VALRLTHELGHALHVRYNGVRLLRYVYAPPEPQVESPRPYFHPVRTLGGDRVSIYRPHDHVWHKGIAWSLPNVGPENFWGGPTYTRDRGYAQLPNNGAMRHRRVERLDATPERVDAAHRLDWVTERGETWFEERRAFTVTVRPEAGAWVLGFTTHLTNVSGRPVPIGSPTTQGRENAGYGGLFWRGPRAFTGGTVLAPGVAGGDELMGLRAPWLGFTGRHDGHGRWSTLVFVDAPENPGHPTRWFVRSEMFAGVCPAPFFAEEVPVPPGGSLALRYAVVIADGIRDPDGAARLADLGTPLLIVPALIT